MRFSTDEIAAAVGGTAVGPVVEIERVGIDSRRIRSGDLFVPIVAERDGHDFIEAAMAAGAAAHLTSRELVEGSAVRVEDTADALTALGAAARDRLGDRVVGVTGSVGKTSLKDLLRAVGGTTWRTWANPGSFNNELGVPLTLCNAPDGTELTVVEMGARGRGHIAELCDTARPTVGIVTVVAGAHLELFRSLDGVAEAKAELVRSLPASGLAVLNADDDRVAAMVADTSARTLTFGIDRGEVRAADVGLDPELRPWFRLRSPWGDTDVVLGVSGRHQVVNALGAAAAALGLGADVEAVAAGLADARLSAHRMALRTLPDGLRILDDAYNANPTSMLAALDGLAALPATRRIAVLGTMAELGSDGVRAHEEIGRAARERGLTVVTVAEPAYGITGELAVDGPEAAAALLESMGLGAEDAVLVKASRSAELERVVALLAGRRAI